ncbi:MAG TPA: hypothetical protein V6C78_12520 [Crinalium sp.]
MSNLEPVTWLSPWWISLPTVGSKPDHERRSRPISKPLDVLLE